LPTRSRLEGIQVALAQGAKDYRERHLPIPSPKLAGARHTSASVGGRPCSSESVSADFLPIVVRRMFLPVDRLDLRHHRRVDRKGELLLEPDHNEPG